MPSFDFSKFSLWLNLGIFAGAALAVWLAGTRLASYADGIAQITGVGRVAIGLVLLGGVTSLPEIAVAGFSAYAHQPDMAVNNLLGGVAMQKAILAGTDAFIGKEALTAVVATPMVLLQATLTILLLILVAAAITVGDLLLWQVGAWSCAIFAAYGFSIWIVSHSQGSAAWLPKDRFDPEHAGDHASRAAPDNDDGVRLKSLVLKTALAGLLILAAGFLLSRSGDAIALQSGLGRSFVGAVLLSLATSLPELSTAVGAMRLQQYEMAIADILGTNLFNVMLIFLVDAVYVGPPVLNEVGSFSLLAALLGIALTTLHLIGLIERRNRTIARMGVDSLAILATYAGGLFLLYQLR